MSFFGVCLLLGFGSTSQKTPLKICVGIFVNVISTTVVRHCLCRPHDDVAKPKNETDLIMFECSGKLMTVEFMSL
jgi:hypothetical protein